MYSTLLELEQAMNAYLATHFPQFFDGSMSELLKILEGPAGGGMGVWVREGRVIEAGVPLGAYTGRLRMRGALPESAYIFSMKRFSWRRRQIRSLEIDGAPYGRASRNRIANVAQYNHTCTNESVTLRHTAWTLPTGRCAIIVAHASERLVGPVELRYKYGPGYTLTEEEADAEVQQGFRVEPCRCMYQGVCPNRLWLNIWE